jgi:hypothetical protein
MRSRLVVWISVTIWAVRNRIRRLSGLRRRRLFGPAGLYPTHEAGLLWSWDCRHESLLQRMDVVAHAYIGRWTSCAAAGHGNSYYTRVTGTADGDGGSRSGSGESGTIALC